MDRLERLFIHPTLGDPAQAAELDLARGNRRIYDAMFAAPKSVSVLAAGFVALGQDEDADQVVAAHELAVDVALEHLNRKAAYGVGPALWQVADETSLPPEERQRRTLGIEPPVPKYAPSVKAVGLAMVQLQHLDARNHRTNKAVPHLHTHVFIGPHVTAEHEGTTHQLDRRHIPEALVMAAIGYRSALTTELTNNLGAVFERDPITEDLQVIGISADLIQQARGTRCRAYPNVHQVYATSRQPMASTIQDPDD